MQNCRILSFGTLEKATYVHINNNPYALMKVGHLGRKSPGVFDETEPCWGFVTGYRSYIYVLLSVGAELSWTASAGYVGGDSLDPCVYCSLTMRERARKLKLSHDEWIFGWSFTVKLYKEGKKDFWDTNAFYLQKTRLVGAKARILAKFQVIWSMMPACPRLVEITNE